MLPLNFRVQTLLWEAPVRELNPILQGTQRLDLAQKYLSLWSEVSVCTPSVSPFNAADLLTQKRQVLSELHHGDDECAPHQRARGPEERANDGPAAVEACQEDAVLLLRGVIVTQNLLVRLQAVWDVHHNAVHQRGILGALWDVKTLQGKKEVHLLELHLRNSVCVLHKSWSFIKFRRDKLWVVNFR